MPVPRKSRARVQHLDDIELENPDDIQKAIAETGGDESQIVLYVENEMKLGSYDFVTKMPVGAFDLPVIQSRYGGGQYRAVFFNKLGEQIRVQEFGIKDISPEEGEESEDKNEKLMRLILEMNRERGRESQPQSNTATEILLPILLKMLDRNPLQDLAAMAALMKGGEGGGVSPLQMMEQLRLEREASLKLGQQLGEAGAGTDSFLKTAITELAPAVSAIASRIGQPTPAMGTPTVAPQIAPSPVSALPSHLAWLLPLRGYLPALLDKAKRGKSPQVYANVLIEEMPEEMLEKMEVSAKASDFVDVILGAITEFQEPSLQAWGRGFLQEIKDHFSGDEEVAQENDLEKKRHDALAKLRTRTATKSVEAGEHAEN